jgi:hypothetical protein
VHLCPATKPLESRLVQVADGEGAHAAIVTYRPSRCNYSRQPRK